MAVLVTAAVSARQSANAERLIIVRVIRASGSSNRRERIVHDRQVATKRAATWPVTWFSTASAAAEVPAFPDSWHTLFREVAQGQIRDPFALMLQSSGLWR